MKLWLSSLGSEAVEFETAESDTVGQLQAAIRQRWEVHEKTLVKVVHDTSVYEDAEETLVALGIEDGTHLMAILENPGPILLKAQNLRCGGSAQDLQLAVRGGRLSHQADRLKVELTLKDGAPSDAEFFVTLREGDAVLAREKLSATDRQATFGEKHEIVRLAKPDTFFSLEYTLGSAQNRVAEWTCLIFYVNSSIEVPSQTCGRLSNRDVVLPHRDRGFVRIRTRDGS